MMVVRPARGGKCQRRERATFHVISFLSFEFCIVNMYHFTEKKKCCFKDSIKAKKRNLRFCFLVGIASWVYFISYPVFYLICDFLE